MITRSANNEGAEDELTSLLNEIETTEKNVVRSGGEKKAISHAGMTKGHSTCRVACKCSFCEGLEAVGKCVIV